MVCYSLRHAAGKRRRIGHSGAFAVLALALVISLPAPAAAGQRAPARDLTGYTILIDPGHDGGNAAHANRIAQLVPAGGFRKACDTVGTSTAGGYSEHAFTWDMARRVTRLLRARGARVVLTRHNDRGWGPCINRRARIGNRAHADAALSIHADGGPVGGRGFHVIRPTNRRRYTRDIFAASRKLALRLRNQLTSGGVARSTYAGRRGIDVRGDLGGLNLSNVPKVFVELGNMRNARDARLLRRARWRQRVAVVLARALGRYVMRDT